jgi:chemotaxis family two-component system sensor kinase Cph1
MVYRFDAEWNGEVIAEALAPRTVSYLGHRFPASDIPAQARQLFLVNPLRAIADTGSAPVPIVPEIGPLTRKPLDLSRSFLRSASPVHIEFLRNWGVQSSMTASIIVDGRLWGMLACQHSAPRHVDCSTRSICELVGRNLGLQIALRNSNAALQERLSSRALLESYMTGIEACKSLVDAESFRRARLLDLLDSDGLVSRIDGIVSSQGVTVPETLLLAVIGKLRSLSVRGIASSNALGTLEVSAESYASTVSGALYIGLSSSEDGDYLLLVRRELVETITWAGNPANAVSFDAEGKLHPRTSFAAWKETMRGHARLWTELELESARFLREQLLHLRDAQKLKKFEERARQTAAR